MCERREANWVERERLKAVEPQHEPRHEDLHEGGGRGHMVTNINLEDFFFYQ